MADPLTVDCQICGALLLEPCVWAGWNFAQPHPVYHPERVAKAEADAVALAEDVVQGMSKESVDRAFQDAIYGKI